MTVSQETKEINNQIINTMIAQLGGGRFMRMTGAKPLVKDDSISSPWVSFKLPRNGSKANYFKLTYKNGLDLYEMEFYSIRAGKMKTVNTYTNLYGDQLEEVFTSETKLYTRL